ncbi:alpha/beta fold hydrolase [Olivibacter sitiensis]|uniref:alpha/beta fold hydrolase n=1 Tax=Olivibacter sitiensis TaxID=376470 RepID=UPI00041EE18D|nr:alpha/beta hydrolase [Olivibacter sitiensis]
MDHKIQRKKIRLSDISISYLYKGSANPTMTIIFIHGFPFNKNMWQGQLEALPDHVLGIAIDVRGHGMSTSGHGFFNIDLFAQDLIAFVEKLQLLHPVLCGISMGGYIALRAREMSPQLFRGFVLVDTHPFADMDAAKVKRFESIQSVLKHGRRAFAVGFVANVFSQQSMLHKPEAVELIKSSIRRNDIRSICATQLALAARTDTSKQLTSLTQPCLLIRGKEDKLTSHEQMQAMDDSIANSKLVEIEHCGHLPNLEDAVAFNSHLLQFLDQFK